MAGKNKLGADRICMQMCIDVPREKKIAGVAMVVIIGFFLYQSLLAYQFSKFLKGLPGITKGHLLLLVTVLLLKGII